MEKGKESGEGMTQLSVFECAFSPIKTKKKIRLIELLDGIGAQAKALENIGPPVRTNRCYSGII